LLLLSASMLAVGLYYLALTLAPCSLSFTGTGPCYRGYQSRFSFDANEARHVAWMASLPDDANITALSIPGTHDTMTAALASTLPLQCQNWDLPTQLRAGIRYLDIRARVVPGDRIHIFHADADTGFDLSDVLQTAFDFLDENPSEIIVMRLKEEGPPVLGGDGGGGKRKRGAEDPAKVSPETGLPPPEDQSSVSPSSQDTPRPWPPGQPVRDGTGQPAKPPPPPPSGPSFESTFNAYRWHDPDISPRYLTYVHHYIQAAPLPTLGRLRGRILLLQEFAAPLAGGADAHGPQWDGERMALEDFWALPDASHLPEKWEAVRDALERAAAAPPHDNSLLYLAHVSASVGVLPIEAAAGPRDHTFPALNDLTAEWLLDSSNLRVPDDDHDGEANGASRAGIVILDFPGRELIDAILSWNDPIALDDYFQKTSG
jgi:1-phosphatidylinositol phosphodiesterase